MHKRSELIRKSIFRDLNEGVIILGMDGLIEGVNGAASEMLGIAREDLIGNRFARTFMVGKDNDQFIQTVLDTIYDSDSKHYSIVPYNNGREVRQLYVMTTYLREGEEKIGIAIILSDITELAELKIQYANSITSLLDSLVKSLSTAIDERSPYTANHARNMVKVANAFIDHLNETGDPHAFDEERRRAYLMSVWLHDVGKLAVPLEVMDKATRLGGLLPGIEARFERVRLLDKIALLEGRITEDEMEANDRRRAQMLQDIRRLDKAGFIADEDMELIDQMSKVTFRDDEDNECPMLTEEELRNLRIRKGTLTDEERAIIRSHAVTTNKILQQVDFPGSYSVVPGWASSHHELLNGTGYPNHLKGDEIPFEVRLLTIIDIYETLTARDRPYKKPIPPEKSLEILKTMADDGSIDKDLLDQFIASGAWKAVM